MPRQEGCINTITFPVTPWPFVRNSGNAEFLFLEGSDNVIGWMRFSRISKAPWLRPNEVRVLIALTLFSASIIVTGLPDAVVTVWAFYSITVVLALWSDARTIASITAVALVLTLIELWIVRWESSRQAP